MEPQTFRARLGEATCTAIQVDTANLAAVAAWCGGHTWAATVVIPTESGGEVVAAPGEWVERVGGRTWHSVWSDPRFTDMWEVVA